MAEVAIATIAQYVAATAAVVGTGLSVQQAVAADQRAGDAEKAAREKATMERLGNSAQAKQQRSLAHRHLLIALDESRVLSAAAGVSGGASQMVLESAYTSQAREDLATLSSNQARANTGISMDLSNTLGRIRGDTPSVGAAAFQGAIQGLGSYFTVQRDLNSLLGGASQSPQPSQTPGADLPPEQVESIAASQ